MKPFSQHCNFRIIFFCQLVDFLTKKQIFRDFLCIRYSWKQLDLQLQIDSHFSNESLPREHVIRRLLDENFDADRIRFAACKSSCGTVTEVTEGKWPFCEICEETNFYCFAEPQKFASEGIFFSIKREIRRIFNGHWFVNCRNFGL